MKQLNKYLSIIKQSIAVFFFLLLCLHLVAQNEVTGIQPEGKAKPVKNTFDGNWILDNQSVMVPIKGTLEMDIQHRFGLWNNGYKDIYGIMAPANIRLGFSYVVINDLQLGFGLTKERLQWDLNAKYAIVKQIRDGGWPISITYLGNIVIDSRAKENFVTGSDRFSYFNQLIFAHKLTDNISLQCSPSISHFNNVPGYKDANGEIQSKLKNEHVAIAFMARYKVSESMNFLVNYDQPLTQHPLNNPHPNLSAGIEFVTSGHSFQLMIGNYQSIVPQSNNLFNKNDYKKSDFLIGFNISRLWNL
jgi:hypothetical protein